MREFRALFEFAGLTWDAAAEARLAAQTSSGDEADPYSVDRHSLAQINRWKREIQPAELADLRTGYCQSPLPWYQSARDWILT